MLQIYYHLASLLRIVLMMTTFFCCKSTFSKAGEPAILSEMIYEQAPFPECHASTIVETDRGLVTSWFGGSHEKHPDVGIWVSRHDGASWSPPVEVANGVQNPKIRYPCWNPVLFSPGTDQL